MAGGTSGTALANVSTAGAALATGASDGDAAVASGAEGSTGVFTTGVAAGVADGSAGVAAGMAGAAASLRTGVGNTSLLGCCFTACLPIVVGEVVDNLSNSEANSLSTWASKTASSSSSITKMELGGVTAGVFALAGKAGAALAGKAGAALVGKAGAALGSTAACSGAAVSVLALVEGLGMACRSLAAMDGAADGVTSSRFTACDGTGGAIGFLGGVGVNTPKDVDLGGGVWTALLPSTFGGGEATPFTAKGLGADPGSGPLAFLLGCCCSVFTDPHGLGLEVQGTATKDGWVSCCESPAGETDLSC